MLDTIFCRKIKNPSFNILGFVKSLEAPQQGRSPSPRRIWRPHFEGPVTVSAGACGGPQDTPSSFTRQTSTPLQGRIQQESTNISSSCIKTLEGLFDNQRAYLQEQFGKQNALITECLSMLKSLDREAEHEKTKRKHEIHVPAHVKQSIRNGFRHNKSSNELKWTTKTAAGTILKFNSEENTEMSEAVLTYVRGQFPTVEEGVIRSGIETHFKSVKQKEIMESSGKKEDNKRKMVLYGRKQRVCTYELRSNLHLINCYPS
ncbi:unnamed protein product [Mytilus coruscus]|uniref:BEN domain-containing protein n=1 Tax=Mytilus coruscus TaxID=42192 RepID=A0A6J8D7D7_MYTCO|nr:unnamed protein product [Mytilus coruscus]